jgi:hypothetical protein
LGRGGNAGSMSDRGSNFFLLLVFCGPFFITLSTISILDALPGKIQPRPSIDEFNLRKGIKPIQRHKTVSTSSQRLSDSDSSDSCQSKKAYRRSPPSRPTLVMTSLHAEYVSVV